MTAGDRALAGSSDTVQQRGSQLSGRTVGSDVYRSLVAAAQQLGAPSGNAMSVERILTRIQASSAPANIVQQADMAWGRTLTGYAARIADLKGRAKQAREDLTSADSAVSAAHHELDGFDGLDTPGDPARRRGLSRAVTEAEECRGSAAQRLKALDEERQGVDAGAATAIGASRAQYIAARNALPRPPTVSAGVRFTITSPDGTTQNASAIDLAKLKEPGKIRALWDKLTTEQQQALIADFPLLIGNLDGIPLRDRNTANVITARTYRSEVEKQIAAFTLLQKQPGMEGLFADKITDLRNEITSIDAILGDRNGKHTDRGAQFGKYVVYDENGGRLVQNGTTLVGFNPLWDSMVTFQGMLDPATGDIPAWMTSVGVSIPGTTSKLSTLTTDLDRTKDLFASSDKKAGYFTWHGAPLPDLSVTKLSEAATRGFADVAAPRLTSFVNSVRLPPAAAVVPIGHSYGAAVLGGAEYLGLRATRVVYVSPAGLGHNATGLQDFPNTKDAPHFLIQPRNDIIGLFQGVSGLGLGHGNANPTTASGITRLETGYLEDGDPNSGSIESTGPIAAHTKVFTYGSTAYLNIVNVVTGKPVSLYHPDDTGRGPHGTTILTPGTGVTKPKEMISPLDPPRAR